MRVWSVVGNIKASASTTPEQQELKQYKTALREWTQDNHVSPAERRGRRKVSDAIKQSIDDDSWDKSLRIGKSNLTSLPPLPPNIESMDASGNPIRGIDELPDSLRVAVFDDMNFSRHFPFVLPERLPPRLERLHVSNSRLEHLPRLPSSIESVTANNNRLTTFDQPELPRLARLELKHNRLTHVPEALWRHIRGSTTHLQGNPLSDNVLRQMEQRFAQWRQGEPTGEEATGDEGSANASRTGFKCHADDSTASFDPRRTLKDSLKSWGGFTIANGREAEGFQREPHAQDAARLLQHIDASIHPGRRNPEFVQEFKNWLGRVAESAAVRHKAFAIAHDIAASPSQHLASAINRISTECRVHDTKVNRRYREDSLPRLLVQARNAFRLERIANIANKKVASLDGSFDPFEVHMAYQARLQDLLELEIGFVAYADFDDSPLVTDVDIDHAKNQVRTTENNEFHDWLERWTPWKEAIAQVRPGESVHDATEDLRRNEFTASMLNFFWTNVPLEERVRQGARSVM